ncbi:ATP-binding protein [Methylocystis parvus]|uniref:ATP-binding protein n=1 Tax=Methylocystis parvus TaxID=134 RepID=UPI003C781A29
MVDEADDVFSGADAPGNWRRGSKAYVNKLVEAAETPTIWIVNDPDMLGPAILRRMTYVLRFPAAGRAVRARIVERIAKSARVALDPEAKSALAALDAPPAIVAHALRTAQLAGDGGAALSCAQASLRVLRGPQPAPAPQPIAYDATLLRADADLAALRDRVVASRTRALSFCFHGPPGTGKSAYARHLAEALGLDVVEKRASDLLSKWVGETEKAIRDAFEEAADRRAFLIFDEADSLLAKREGAAHSWEVTQVNEMLVCMERHPLPFACATNAFQTLDPAALRRFLFKVAFLPMAKAEVALAFAKAFGAPAPQETLALDNLTPGDFAVVARKARVLDERDADTLALWLRQEAEAKPDARRPIGF